MSNNLKLIHVVENLDKGAVENWLVNIFLESRHHRPEWEWTFYCILGRSGRLDDKVIAAGGKIIYSPVTISDKLVFLRHLRKTLLRGNYDVIHSHHDYLSGFYLLSTIGLSFRRRILHLHNNDKGLPIGNKTLYKILLPVFRWLAIKMTDDVVGISKHTLEDFRMTYKEKRPVFEVLYYGIDLHGFEVNVNPVEFRKSIGLPENSKILLFVGRMIREKNPEFLVRILERIFHTRKDVYAVFVGKGDLENKVDELARALKISDHVRAIGWSNKISSIMKSSDVFVFPRLEKPKEGLGLVIIEAQAAGLPVFVTEGIVKDAVVINELVHINDLCDIEAWVNQIQLVLDKGTNISQEIALKQMKNSVFELRNATENTINFYERKLLELV